MMNDVYTTKNQCTVFINSVYDVILISLYTC